MLFGALAALGCDRVVAPPQPAPPYKVAFLVSSDPGRPLPGATLSAGGKDLGTTDGRGRAELALAGNEGELVDVTVKCPAGFSSPPKPFAVALRRLVDDRVMELAVACPPTRRRVILAVRAENGPNLPIRVMGSAAGRTDRSGAAHVMLDAAPGDRIEVQISTDEKGSEGLMPKNPVFSHVVNPHDELVVVSAQFSVEKKIVHRKAKPKAPTEVPAG
jgi:hypothetical protein